MIKVEDIAFVRFRAPDLARMKAFLEDFGLVEAAHDSHRLFMRGAGKAAFVHATEQGEPGFAGLGFRAEDPDDLQRLARSENARLEPFEAPGGGQVVRLTDPDGNSVEVVAGQKGRSPDLFAPREAWNDAVSRSRFRKVKRTGDGAAHVVRLGHCVLNVADFRKSESWYKERFGLITSDEIELQPGFSIGAFLRCDRGDKPADHHTLFLVQSPKGPGFNHAAFEVRDFDDLMSGHTHLKLRGAHAEWGVGRHLLGSQVFDYWRDPYGHTLEHWTDGDLLTAADGSNKVTLTDLLAVQWGPQAPPTMG
jgi:catechol 2,3-dioxygenase-like lactoylglutathione lyase family enzyme